MSLSLFAVGTALASDDWRDIRTGENSLVYSQQDVFLRGSWSPKGDYKYPRIDKVNVTHIVCERRTMICRESLAGVAQLRGRDAHSSPNMTVVFFEYAVEQWSPNGLIARRVNPSGPEVNAVLKFDFAKGIVTTEWKDRPGSDGYFQPAEQANEIVVEHPYAR